MCGRYTLTATDAELIAEFELAMCEPITPNRNVCPSQNAPVIRESMGCGRTLQHLRWGFLPSWAKDPASAYKMINARSEEASGKPAFRDAMKKRRCLIPCSGFYEWKAIAGAPKSAKKQPYVFELEGSRPFALAGLWERWLGADSAVIESFAILTKKAGGPVSEIHDRMPVILRREVYASWLDSDLSDPATVQRILDSASAEQISCRAVDSL